MTAEDAQTFTHLESLLLFQSVAAYGNTADSFARISTSLKTSELLQRDTTNDSDRLNPQALTDLYLRLLKSEAKRSLQNASQSTATDSKKADAPTSSRRSEVPSPKLASIEDAERHRHLEPIMISKLYDLYKDQVIQEIKEEEQKYDQLVGEAKGLEIETGSDRGNATQIASHSVGGENAAPSKVPDAGNEDTSMVDRDASANESTSKSQRERTTRNNTPSVAPLNNPPVIDNDTLLASKQASDMSSTSTTQIAPQPLRTPGRTPGPALKQQLVPNTPSASHAATQSSNVGQRLPSPSRAPIAFVPEPNKAIPSTDPHKTSTRSNRDLRDPHPNHTSAAQNLPPFSTSVSSRAGGMQLPPFQVLPQAPHQSQQAQQSKQATSQAVPKQGRSTLNVPNSSTPVGKSLPLDTRTPANTNDATNTYSPPKSDSWKALQGAARSELPRPRRDVSPISDDDTSPQPTSKSTPSRRQKPTTTDSIRETRKSKAARASSKTPSVVPSNQEGTKSESEMSMEDDASGPGTRSTARRVKQDTPISTTDAQPSARQTRALRNAGASSLTTSMAGKRKRASTLDTETAPTPASTSGPTSPIPTPSYLKRRQTADQAATNTITASRNFHKTSAPILNNIGSHRHASLFSAPVSTRTAGYYDIIKRPTDLASIRKAIHAGSRAITAATTANATGSPSVSTPGASGGGSGDTASTITLPISKELVPPEAIVNSAQLEQEVMRMFANAVMFNEGDDGVVRDTREMFGDTEKTLADWMGAESTQEGGEDVNAADDGGGVTSGKRRRL